MHFTSHLKINLDKFSKDWFNKMQMMMETLEFDENFVRNFVLYFNNM